MNDPRTVAAFFDIDGTLVPSGSLEWRFVLYLLSRDKLSARNIAHWLLKTIGLAPHGWRRAIEANKFYLKGLPVTLAEDWADSTAWEYSNRKAGPVSDEGLNRTAWHQSQNHRVFLISGTLAPLATAVANFLPGQVEVVATESAEFVRPLGEGRECAVWSGELAGEHVVGEAKVRAVRALATKHRLKLDESYAYGDSLADCGMLECVGHPEVVNPSRTMAIRARERMWPVHQWKSVNATRGDDFSGITAGKRISLPGARAETR